MNDTPKTDNQQALGHQIYVRKLTLAGHPYIKDVDIDTKQANQHIIITGKNGVGKSTLLQQIKDAIRCNPKNSIHFRSEYSRLQKQYQATADPLQKKAFEPRIQQALDAINRHGSFCDLEFNNSIAVDLLAGQSAVQAFFNAKRSTELASVAAVSATKVPAQPIDQPLAARFKQHLVNSKTQLSFARDDGDNAAVAQLEAWFNTLDQFMTEIFEQPIKLKFDRKALDYKIASADGTALDFNHLSEGYGAIINIIAEIIMRMEVIENGNFSLPGIVLIDEIETHLHVRLQKKILRLLTVFFPNIQFIVTTHSPFVLTSLEDACIFDMSTNTCIDAKQDLWQYSYEDIVEGYFETEPYSKVLESKIARYETLSNQDPASLSIQENKELLLLKPELTDAPTFKLADIELRLQALGLKS